MCGFYAAFSSSRLNPIFKDHVELSHRGPDASGEATVDELYMKHYRLSILGGEGALQPMTSMSGDKVIVFNGEIYNYKEIARDVLKKSELSSLGDTRVLVELIDQLGLARSLPLLNGMFSFLIYSRSEKTAHIARDRLGIKPLYYSFVEDQVLVASEIKAFFKARKPELSPLAVRRFLELGSYPGPEETFYHHIHALRPGTSARLQSGALDVQPYFSLMEEVSRWGKEEKTFENFESLIEDSIKIRLRSDVPVNLNYSGGTDSTALLLKTKEVFNQKPELLTYTMGYEDERFDESSFARQYCQQLNVSNETVVLTPQEVPDLAEELQYFQDEPYAGIPCVAYYKLNKMQKEQGYTVGIEGQGADECLGGYLSHIVMAIDEMQRLSGHEDLIASLLAFIEMPLDETLQFAEKLKSSGFRAHTDLTDFRPSDASNSNQANGLAALQEYDILQNKLPRLLRFEDRGSMAASREIRFPFLDHRVFTLALSLDFDQKYRGGVSKAPLREIIRRYLGNVYQVPKRNVVTPQTAWLQGPLRDWASDHVQSLKRRNVLENNDFEKFEKKMNEGKLKNSFFLWQMVNLNILMETNEKRHA